MSDDENFRWTEQLTAILVKKCYQKKTDFQNPKMRKSDLFKDIVEHFKELGHSVTTRILYQKYCNIKGTYIRIIKKGQIHKTRWPYFAMISDIVGEHYESYRGTKSGHSSPESNSQSSYPSKDVKTLVVSDGHKTNDFHWNHDSISLLLEEYLKRVLLFHDPKVKRKDLWHEIQSEFEEAGWDISSDLLDRKFRILKNTYQTIKKNNRKPITWKYFDTFEKIYADPDEGAASTRAKHESELQETEIEFIKTESIEMADEAEIIDMYTEVEVETDDSEEEESEPEPTPKKRKVVEDYHEARLSLERRKVKQLERLNDGISEHLSVMKELLKVVKQKLN